MSVYKHMMVIRNENAVDAGSSTSIVRSYLMVATRNLGFGLIAP